MVQIAGKIERITRNKNQENGDLYFKLKVNRAFIKYLR
jgi:hypothetical protein